VSASHLDDVAPPLTRDPDRQATVFGLSVGGWHRIAYTDWGALGDPAPVVCVPGLSGKVGISTSWRKNSRVRAAGSYVPICRAAAAVAGWRVRSTMFFRNIAPTSPR